MTTNFDSEVKVLSIALADAFVLMVKTQAGHWNVVGSNFYDIHSLTEVQYNELFAAIDEIAEQIRILGSNPPSTASELVALSKLKEGSKTGKSALPKSLASANSKAAGFLRDSLASITDPGTVDLLTQRMRAYEKSAWMWRAMSTKPLKKKKANKTEEKETEDKPVVVEAKPVKTPEKPAKEPKKKVEAKVSPEKKPAAEKVKPTKAATTPVKKTEKTDGKRERLSRAVKNTG